MVDDYQLRKDIDRIARFIEGLNTDESLKELLSKLYDQSEIDIVTAKLDTDLVKLDGSLDTLKGNLVTFNQKLITFNGDTETLATDLDTLGDNLNSVLEDISQFTRDLSDLNDSFTQLDGELTTLGGDLTNFGNDLSSFGSELTSARGTFQSLGGRLGSFDTSLTGLDTSLNGLSSELTTARGTFNNLGARLGGFDSSLVTLNATLTTLSSNFSSTSSSLNRVLADIYDANGDLIITSEDMTALSNRLNNFISDLGTLSEYIEDFEGDLSTLQEELADDPNVNLNVLSINSSIVKLFGAIGTVKEDVSGVQSDVETVQSDISDVQVDMYGSNKDPNNPQTGSLMVDMSTAQSDITTVQGQIATAQSDISTVQVDMYGSNKDPNSPQTGSIVSDLNDAQGDITTITGTTIPAVQGSVNDVKIEMYGETSPNSGIPNTPANKSADSLVALVDDATDAIEGLETSTGVLETDMYGVNGTSGNPTGGLVTDISNTQTTLYGGGNNTPQSPSSNSVMGKVSTVQTDMYGSNKDPNHPQTGSLVSDLSTAKTNIGTIQNTDIPAVQGDIGDIQGIMYGNGSVQSPETGSLLDNIDTVQDNITDVQADIGDVDLDLNSDLQTQILTLIRLVNGILPTVLEVTNLSEVSNYGSSQRGNLLADPMFPYELVYVTSSHKYYQVQNLDTSGALGYYGEWVEISTPSSTFNQTELYTILNDYYCPLSALNNKQNTIPSMSLKQTITNGGGGTIKIYSDGLYVLVVLNGTFTKHVSGNSNIVTNGNTVIGAISNSEYCPSSYVLSACDTYYSNNNRVYIENVGNITLVNATTSTSVSIRTQFMYPVASRMP